MCEDRDGDGRCGPDAPGLPGVRLVLETGHAVVTDALGRFHFAALDARTFDARGGLHLRPGRHRLKVDGSTLPPGAVLARSSVTLEVPMGALVQHDFAVRLARSADAPVQGISSRAPSGVLQGERVRFTLRGQAGAGDRVQVQGAPAEVDVEGRYSASVWLEPGSNAIAVSAQAPTGAVRLLTQKVELIRRAGSVLVVPGALEPLGVVRLPLESAAGVGAIRVEAAPGTVVAVDAQRLTVGPDGALVVPVQLKPGANQVAVELMAPSGAGQRVTVSLEAKAKPFVVGLLDLEGQLEPATGRFRLLGRGAAHGEHRVGKVLIAGELALDDADFAEVRRWGAGALAAPRRPERLERALDVERYPTEWGDDAIATVPNAPEGRLRLDVRHDDWGGLGFGTTRAQWADSEVGRYQRELFGPSLEVHTPKDRFAWAGLSAFAAPGLTDPTRGLALAPAHEELRATGGSVYYLGHFGVAQGSEVVRVEVRDGITGLTVRERHLSRGRDYEIDYAAGRILLAEPLSFLTGAPLLLAEPLTRWPEPVLVVDYERVLLSGEGRDAFGGRALGGIGPATLSVGGLREQGGGDRFTLYRATARAPVGPLVLMAEAAQSAGAAIGFDAFGVSDDGGLSFLRPSTLGDAEGQALTLRARGKGIGGKGYVDASFRRRTSGFSDAAHADPFGLRQASLLAEQPFGNFAVGALVDDRLTADPRAPFSTLPFASRTLGLLGGWRRPSYGVSLELKDAQLQAADAVDVLALDGGGGSLRTGGRSAAGLSGYYQAHPRVKLVASHKQVLFTRGEGPGTFDDSFSALGADVAVDGKSQVGVRGGWGPRLGPLVWGQAERRFEEQVWYGGYSVDVDGPAWGERRAVTGARTEVDDAQVFVEDTAAHDANQLRLSRAVGVRHTLMRGLELSGRYEHGLRDLLGTAVPGGARDAGGLSVRWIDERVRLYGRAELRDERGAPARGLQATPRRQRLVGVGSQVSLARPLSASARLHFTDTAEAGRVVARLLEGSAGLSLRWSPALVVLRYAIERELPPPSRGLFAERTLHIASLLPSVRFGRRFALAAGGHAGWSVVAGDTGLVLSGALRPSVAVVGGLELAAEVARRSSAPDGGALTAWRGEAGYRFTDEALVALGYTFAGFSGLGVSATDPERHNRLYLRAELGF